MASRTTSAGRFGVAASALNGRYHRLALNAFMVVVVAHWAEHIVQAIQVYALGWPVPEARGVLGRPFPWLVTSEWMHYAYALLMLVGLVMLRAAFAGRSRTWWSAALALQVWHHFEHLILLVQALTGSFLAGRAQPTSIIQLLVPRVELHLFYNAVVFLPMVVAMIYHRRPRDHERASMRCNCARIPELQSA
jgi:hypothetical protein